MKSIRKILACIRQADRKFNLINPGDKIAVGVSGGKDSLVLAYSLILYQKFAQKSFELVFVLLNLGFKEVDFSSLINWFSSLGYALHIEDATNVNKILVIQKQDKEKLSCSICSRMKKAAINKVAHEYNCNKVAFAHHADDAIETLFMNEIFGARVTTFSPKMLLEKTNLIFIRPLILAREATIAMCANELQLPITSLGCPNDHHTSREDIKELLATIYKSFPDAKENFLTMLTNYEKNGLWEDELFYQIEGSNLSVRPVILIEDLEVFKKLQMEIFNEDNENKKGSLSYLLYLNDEPIGLARYDVNDNREINIDLFAIKEDKRKQGYGSLFLSWIEKEIFDQYNPCSLYLKLIVDDFASFFIKRGFEKVLDTSLLLKNLTKIPS